MFTDLGNNRYRVEQFDSLGGEYDFHDVLQAVERPDDDLDFVRIEERSDCETHFNILSLEEVDSTAIDRVFAEVRELGGYAECFNIGCVYIAMPKDVDYDPWEKMREHGKYLYRGLEIEALRTNKEQFPGKWSAFESVEGIEFQEDGTYVRFESVTVTVAGAIQRQLVERAEGRWTWLEGENIEIEESGLPKTKIRVDFDEYSLSIPRSDGTLLYLAK